MNGVIIDDEQIHQETWRQLGKKYNLNLTEEEFQNNISGRTEKDVFVYLLGKELTPRELAERSAERVKIAIDIFKPQLALAKGLLSFLESLRGNNIPIAVATSARRPYTDFILDGLEIRKYFQKIVTAEDVTKGKPDPEMYLLAAKQIDVKPTDCVVFEDSVSGIKAGKAAGMKVIAITTTYTGDELVLADKVIDSFDGVTISDLNKIFD